ncbi:MAG: cation:proton antiporter [Methanomassiliicoccales archaeon]|nr:cation:proton antiporter [Methanomassiliicoccales archaeon]
MGEAEIQLVLFQLFVIILLVEVARIVCNKTKVPSVIGEILVGIIIANTILMGLIDLDSDMDFFMILKNLGVIFLLFSVGLQTPFSTIRKIGGTAILVATCGVLLPFFAGYGLMVGLGYPLIESLFVGAALVATSVGITARVIKDMDLMRTIESRVIIGAAVIDDVQGMIVLAIVVGIAGGGAFDIVQVGLVSVEAVLFVLAIIFIGSLLLPKMVKGRSDKRRASFGDDRPRGLFSRLFPNYPKKRREKKAVRLRTTDRRSKGISPLPLALIICFALSFVSSYIGLAAIIGAFLAGMAFAEFKDTWPCESKIEPITEFLSPFFFVFVGISVVLADFKDVIVLALVITGIAIVTKFIGCGLGAKKLGGKSMAIIGVGMIPRGEVGLIVASIGITMIDKGTGLPFIEQNLYNAIVFMSVATTLMAPPLLSYTFKRKHGKNQARIPADVEQRTE